MGSDTFLTQTHCDRCKKFLTARITSWFTEETICMECSSEEFKIKQKLPNGGRDYEGCGYIPETDKETK